MSSHFGTSLIFGVRMSVNSFHRVYDSRLGITIEILSKAHAEVQLKAELFFSRRETNVISYPFRSHPPCRKVTASALLDRGVTVRAPATTSLSIPTVLVRGTPRVLYRHVCHRSQSMSKQSVKDRGPSQPGVYIYTAKPTSTVDVYTAVVRTIVELVPRFTLLLVPLVQS